jgi:translation initiation factor 1
LRLEKRKKGKLVSVVSGLALTDPQRETLTATLKTRCGTGGTFKDDQIELQGDQIDRAEEILKTLGYRTKRQ